MSQYISRNITALFKLKLIVTNLNNFKSCTYHNLKLSNRYITSTQTYFNLNSICWKCGKQRKENLFCDKCQIIQKPPEKQNYFNIFGIEENFNLDAVHLRNRFRQLQSLVHPDKFTNKSDEEKVISEEYSTLLNKAYNYLQTPLKRAEYLLKLKGGESILDSETVDEPAFLMEVMTLNEEVEDSKTNAEQLKLLNEKNKMELDKLIKFIDGYFISNDLNNVRKSLIKMKYFTSLGERINNYLREMGVTD